MAAAFARLDQVTISSNSAKPVQIQPQLQALIALTALPSKWEMLIPIIVSGKSLEDISLYDVRETVVSQFLTETNQGKHKAPQNANKLSAVKRKQGNPRFSKQESSTGNTPNQQQHQQRGARGGGGKPKDKGKGKAKPKSHSHVASMAIPDPIFTTDAALPPPSSSTIAHIGASSSKVTRTVKRSPPSVWVDGVYPSINKTLSLLERMEVSPSIQTAKNIEERFLAIDKEVRARAGFEYDDDTDYSDVDMLQSFLECSIYWNTPVIRPCAPRAVDTAFTAFFASSNARSSMMPKAALSISATTRQCVRQSKIAQRHGLAARESKAAWSRDGYSGSGTLDACEGEAL